MCTAFGNRNGIKFTGDPRGSPLSFPPLPCWPSLSHLIKSGGLSTPCPLFFLRCDKYVFMRHREHELAGVYVRLVIQTAVFIYVQKKHVVATLFHTIHSESNVKHIVAISLHTIRKQCQTYCFYFVSHDTIREQCQNILSITLFNSKALSNISSQHVFIQFQSRAMSNISSLSHLVQFLSKAMSNISCLAHFVNSFREQCQAYRGYFISYNSIPNVSLLSHFI